MTAPVPGSPASRRVAIVLKGYPRLSETFIAQEIAALEERGLDAVLVSLRHPTDTRRHPVHERIAAPVVYLPEYLWHEPARVWRGWRRARRLPGYEAARRAWLADWRRDRTPNRGRRFGQACVLAAELGGSFGRLYAHFLHTPASVARYAATMLGVPWSVSAHAKDVWTIPDWEKREKLAAMDWAVTCTAVNRDHLAALADDAGKVNLVYHGLDLARLPAPAPARPARDGADPADPVVLLSVGRLVAKKGYDVLLEALSRLPRELHWRLVHVGGGPLGRDLARQAAALGLDGRIAWHGAQARDAVFDAYRAADLFVLASRIAAGGDRDGLPNVLMEAQAMGLACVSTTVSAIPELIDDGATGLLVPPDDAGALAAALAAAIGDPARRAALAAAGQARVRRRFAMEPGIERLATRLGLAPAAARRSA